VTHLPHSPCSGDPLFSSLRPIPLVLMTCSLCLVTYSSDTGNVLLRPMWLPPLFLVSYSSNPHELLSLSLRPLLLCWWAAPLVLMTCYFCHHDLLHLFCWAAPLVLMTCSLCPCNQLLWSSWTVYIYR
jgi:hypothetical protein